MMALDPAGMIAYPASAGGTLTRVLEIGQGREVVLFLHGVGARADRWIRNMPEVASAGYRCLAIDLPGHGFAQKGDSFPYGVPGYSDFVETFLNERGIGTVHLVGTSLGAHVLATVLCRGRTSVRSITLVGATGMFPVGAAARDSIAARISDRSREGIRRKLNSVMFHPRTVSESLVEEEWRINNSPGTEEAFGHLARYFRERLDRDVIGDRLAEAIGDRARLVIWGEQDRSVPLSIGQSVGTLLNTDLVVIPDTAHAPYWEAAGAFNQALMGMLAGA